jgi:photosystem II stability/assembly factor-like uncharacterized protein
MKRLPLILLMAALLPDFRADAQTWSWTWVRKVGNSGFNHSITVNPKNPNVLYGSPGNNSIVISRDRGRTWQSFSSIPGGSQIKMIRINARDTSIILAAQEAGPPDRIMKSTDNGASWTQVFSGNFWYWGHPLAYEPAAGSELVYTMGSNVVYRSIDFGTTWNQVGPTNPFGSSNQGWESAIIRPDSSNILLVADNATGIWKSTDSGNSWRRVFVASGEVPALALDMTNPAVAYGTKFGGGGGFVKTTNYGETWQAIPQFNGINTWGVDVSPVHPNYVVMGTWGHSFGTNGGIYISRDAGLTWERTYQGLGSTSNHQCFVLDTLTVLVLQGDGIWKLIMPGKISGVCFNDLNANGSRDPGEPGLQNWKISLSGTRIDSAFTNTNGEYEFSLLGAGTYAVSVQVPSGWTLTLPPGGTYSSLNVTDGEQHPDKNFGLTQQTSVAVPLTAGWNMISNPVITPDDSVRQLYPQSLFEYAFTYAPGAGYVQHFTMERGLGFWAKFSSSHTNTINGSVLSSDSIDVQQGWNMIGSISCAVDTSAIVTVPAGIRASSWFGYDAGYYVDSQIVPGKAYWVKVSQNGKIVLRCPPASNVSTNRAGNAQ